MNERAIMEQMDIEKYVSAEGRAGLVQEVCQKIKKICERYHKTLEEMHGSVDIIPNVINNFVTYIEDMYAADWCMFVHDIDFMENIFHIGSELHIFRDYIQSDRYQTILDNIRPFLYMDDANHYPLNMLKRMCIFKGVKGYNKMNKAQICNKLRRPPNESYYFTI